ncbi:MAG: ABC transporter substrate-binding protein [Desulfobacteraceae bacterium]|nr:ABC transporter substrate-binding protein [Desulfobacteraceae bacterium]
MTFSKPNRFLLVMMPIVAALFLLAFLACSKKEKEPEVIKIGAILPLTGQLGYIGQEEKNAFDMALRDLDEKTRSKFRLICTDSKGIPKEGVALFNKLVSIDDAKIIITSLSAVTNSILPIAVRNDIVLLAITIQPNITDNKNNVFRIWPNSLDEWRLLLNYIKGSDLKNLGLYYSAGDFGLMAKEFFEKELPKIGRTLVYAEMVKIGQADVASLIVKHKYENIDGALIICYPGDARNIVRKMRENKIEVPILSYLTFTYDFLRKSVAKEAEGTVFTCPSYSLHKSRNLRSREFAQEYLKLYKKEPNWNAAFSYDLMAFIIKALEDYKGPLHKEALIEELEKLKHLEGVTGIIRIKPDHDSEVSLDMAVLRDGKMTPLSKE